MSVFQKFKQQLQEYHDAGGVVDPLGIAGELIQQHLDDGTFSICSKCNRMFETDRLLDGVCELCKQGIKHKSLWELKEEQEE